MRVDAGVITPYAKQQGMYTSSGARGIGPSLPDGVEVKTVDGFQGREKDIIVFDTVRSNDKGRIGFLQVGRSALPLLVSVPGRHLGNATMNHIHRQPEQQGAWILGYSGLKVWV